MTELKEVVLQQRNYFETGETKELDFRLKTLKTLKQVIIQWESSIGKALRKDLNKDPYESYLTEIGIVLSEINYIIKNLPKWVGRKRVRTPLAHFWSNSFTYPEPYGHVLIISPWNYPFLLSMAPLVGAIAAGNCVIIKPSEFSYHTSEIMEKLIKENFAENYIAVLTGGQEVSKMLLQKKFDYIFFTGSVPVGKIVMQEAAKYLTPVTLELGGKSPCIVDETADIELAAKRIVWGKSLNAGQTCIAPDYLLVHGNIKAQLLEKMKFFIEKFYGKEALKNQSYPKIINERHFGRLLELLADTEIFYGGKYNEKTLQIAPTIVEKVDWSHPLMEEEIFGPILPVLEFNNLDEAISQIQNRPKPLALYLFTKNRESEDRILQEISFGGGCINDTIIHTATPYLSFGGVGGSGMGGYHGKASFDTFSHYKSVIKKSNLVDIPLRYPPYKESNLKLVKRIIK